MKKRIWARFFSFVLLCAFFVQALPIASAAEVTDSGSCGENLTWTLDTDGLLTISGTGEMEDYSSYGNVPWNGLVDKINCVVIRNGVTSISYGAFVGCTGLTSVTIPNSVTSIGGGAFAYCTGLTSVTISDSVTSIDYDAFYGCTGLTSITVSGGNKKFDSRNNCNGIIETATNKLISGCKNTDIPDSVTSIAYGAFCGCTGLTSITIPDSVTSIDNQAFAECSGLTSVTIPDSVTSIGDNAFRNCTGLARITFPNSVTSIGYGVFSGCTGLTNVTIPDSVTSINSNTFSGCTGLTSVTIPNSVTRIGYSAFYGCTGLTSVTIPDSVTNIGGGAFYGCTGLTSITVSGGNKKFDSRNNCNGIIETASNTLIYGCKNTDIPDSVTSIGESAFRGCTGLTSITIPDSVTDIGVSAFEGCTGLASISFSNSVTSIGYGVFSGCTGLTSITIPDSVTDIGVSAFEGCTGLTSVCFMGDAPVVYWKAFQTYDEESYAFINIPGLTLYYIEGKSGWTTPTWGEAEYPTAVWDGVNIPQPHTHSYTAVVTAPTCTEKGYTTYTCACGDSYKKDFVSALGHDFKDGTCTRCGASDPNYKPVDPTPEATFTDVSETAWYKNSVDYAVEHGLMNGTGSNTFEPESTMTRAMLVTVLWRYANAPKPGANPFTDVPNGKWYTDAVAWAAENGVVNGVGDGKFEPDGSVTREQMATILYRYAQKVGIDTSKHTELSAFPDANRVSAYARAPMQWIVAEGVIGGSRENGQDWLNPQGNATRAEVATILMRFIENVAKRPQ